jgi:CTD nuclear envelope phosphatase 1
MEDVDTVDFEGGESESDEDIMAAAATAAAAVSVDDPLLPTASGNVRADQAVREVVSVSSDSPAVTTPTQDRQTAEAKPDEGQDYFGPAAGARRRYEGGMGLEDYDAGSSRGGDSGPMMADPAESKRDVELREAREASAALQSSIEEDERAARLSEAILDENTGSVPIPAADTTLPSCDDQAALIKKEQSLSPSGQESANTPPSRIRKGRSSPATMFRNILMLIRRAILAFVLAPYDAVTFAVSVGTSKKRRKVEVSLKEPPLVIEQSEKSAVQPPGDEAPRKKKKLRSTASRTRDDTDNVDDVVTEEQAMERAERQRQAALALKQPAEVMTPEETSPTLASGIASKLSKLLPNPHAVDPMLVHEPKAKKITGELPDEIVQRHQRSASLSLLKARAQAGNATGSPETKATLAPGGTGTPPVAVSPAATPIPRSVVIHHTPKILVLDLDETLIHSTSRSPTWTALRAQHSSVNGRAEAARNVVTTGGSLLGLEGLGGLLGLTGSSNGRSVRPHMVEVVLDGRSVIYHVYKRPWVDYFLRKVSTWYQVVIFTASVQEYGDPVIDWLDQGRGLIAGRLYRDACTYKNGSYLKDLSIVDLDLSRVCLVDNSPASYFLNPCE